MTHRVKGWYFIKYRQGEVMVNSQWVPASSWRPAFWNPDGYSRPTWFADGGDEIKDEQIVEVKEIELSRLCGLDWRERC